MNEHVAPNKFRRYRERKRAAGYREVRMWVPDLQSPLWQSSIERGRASTARGRDADALRRDAVRLPDTLAAGFADEVRRQARLIADSDEGDVMALIEATVDTENWPA